MKRVLITGANSYIGMSFETYAKEHYGDSFEIDTIDMQDSNWRETDFSKYDVVFHVAGIAHRKETKENRDLYFKVNRDLVIEVAQKAKWERVKHFIFLSSMSVYGMLVGTITRETQPKPVTAYGISKLEAEDGIFKLADENFKVSVLRPPMVYGKNCKGNYQLLRKFALKVGVFPTYKNKRSMIFIENLSAVLIGIIQCGETDTYFPQNLEYMSSAEIVERIGICNGKTVYMTKIFNPCIGILIKYVPVFQKVFGSLIYDMNMNVFQKWIVVPSNIDCINKTEC